jgi:protein SCO1/2
MFLIKFKLNRFVGAFTFVSALIFSTQILAHSEEKHADRKTLEQAGKISSVDTAKPLRSWSRKRGRDYFPDMTLLTEDREEVQLFDDLLKDKVVAINFIFTSCVDACPLETAKMKGVYEILGDRMGKDTFFYSITIDPEFDTPEVLKAYKEKFGIDGPGWTFLTGNEAEIILLRKKLGLYQPDLPTDDDHNINLIIGNQSTGRWMKRSPFEDPYILATHIGDWLHNWQSDAKLSKASYSEAPELRDFQQGESLFRTRCSACHRFGSDTVGPDLMNVTQRRDREWLKRWLKEPDRMLAEKDPLALEMKKVYKIDMPNLHLNDLDVEKLISFMETESKRVSNATN